MYFISIHALVKRATVYLGRLQNKESHFNPRPREEGDHLSVYQTLIKFYFNPRPREEGDT